MNNTELQDRLAEIELFQGMTKRAIKRVMSMGRTTQHADGHEVITEGVGATGFHLITAGKARVTSAGRVRRTLGAGDYFGEISVLDGKPRSSSIEAVGRLETFMIPPSVFKSLMDEQPALTRRLLIVLCTRLREAESRNV